MRIIGSLAIVLACAAAGCTDRDTGPAGDEPIALEQPSAFWLPVNSLRFGASGRVPGTDLCVGLAWELTSWPTAPLACDDLLRSPPYAVAREVPGGACGEVWDYGPSADVLAVDGCAVPDLQGTNHRVSIDAELVSPLFTGLISIDTP